MVLLWAIAAICTFYLIQPFTFWLISLFRKFPERLNGRKIHYTCIITAYRQMDSTDMLVRSILKTGYSHLEVLVIADQASPDTLETRHPQLRVIVPGNPLNSKLKSIALGLKESSSESDGIIVFDPDNLVAADFFERIQDYIHAGFEVVQGIRVAKNQETDISRAASLGEYYHNYCDRLVPFKAGGSPTISGSGYYLSKSFAGSFFSSADYLKRKDHVILGEDKLLQSYAALNSRRIAFDRQSVIYDEKVSSGNQVRHQRARWINSYFENLPMALRLFTKGDWNAFLMALTSTRPPMLILLCTGLLVMGICWIFIKQAAAMIAAGLVIFFLYFLFAARKSPHAAKVSFFAIPVFVFHQFFALINARKQRKEFIVTEKNKSVSIDEMK